MGRAPCCDKANVKRGPWSPEEDTTLKNYLHTHGTAGNWITLPHKAGLKRCGKSCRLRWLNYLRPDIKHGGFTEEEDDIICTLYKNIGSRWSLIASQLPGRTDNDVKNYWNTKLKKKLMAGLGKSNLTINTTINNNNNNSTCYFTSLSSSSIPHHQNYYNFSSSTSLNYPKPISVPSSMEMGLSLNPHQNLVSNPLGLISSSISVNNNNTNTSTTYSSSSPQEISGPSVSSSTDLALINNNYFSLSNGGGGGGGAGDEFESLLMDFGFGYSSTDVLINGLGFQEKPM